MSNDEAKAGAVIASSPAFSQNELRKYMPPMSGTGSIENSFNHGIKDSVPNLSKMAASKHSRQPSGSMLDLNSAALGTPLHL